MWLVPDTPRWAASLPSKWSKSSFPSEAASGGDVSESQPARSPWVPRECDEHKEHLSPASRCWGLCSRSPMEASSARPEEEGWVWSRSGERPIIQVRKEGEGAGLGR